MKLEGFLPRIVLEHDREKPWQEWLTGTVLFADVSGFTPMSEALSVLGAEGAELLTGILNRYFAAMIGIIGAHGGQVMKFGGDALQCFFPENGDWHMRSEAEASLSSLSRKTGTGTCGAKRRRACPRFPGAEGGREDAGDVAAPFRVRPDAPMENRGNTAQAEACGYNQHGGHPELDSGSSLIYALRAARLMQEAMARFQNIKTPVKKFTLRMKIGLAHGECLLAGVGDPALRCDYIFAGAPVDDACKAEHHAVAGEIIFAGDGFKVQSSKFKVEKIEDGFWRILGVSASPVSPASIQAGDPERTLKGSAPHPSRASVFRLPPSASSYLIAEVHEMVAAGYAGHVGALSNIVSAFMQFTGFRYTHEQFDLGRFHAFFSMVLEITHKYGGRLNRISMGDKGSTFLLLFGAPNALEKKEELASQWALDIQKLISERFPGIFTRIGINSGRVFCGIVGGSGRWDYTVMGDSVNFAARLMQGAQIGQACVGEHFRESAQEQFDFEPLGTHKFKGKAEELAVWALRAKRRATLVLEHKKDFVGRAGETDRIMGLLRSARAGKPGMAVIEGEPGVGKSYLADHVLGLAQGEGWHIHFGRGEIARQSHSYAPWIDLLKALFFPERSPAINDLKRLLKKEYAPNLAWHAALFRVPADQAPASPVVDEETRKNLFHHQLSTLILEKAKGKPILLFLDDLHWFDTLSLDLLQALLNHFKDQAVFILAAARPEWEKKDFASRAACAFVALTDMDKETIRALAASVLGGPVREEVVSFVHERTSGNPFFTRQLLDFMQKEGFIQSRLGEWTVSREAASRGALSGEEVIIAQAQHLSPEQRLHLQAAACIGPTFQARILEHAMGRSFRKMALDSLVASGYFRIEDARRTPSLELRTDVDANANAKQRDAAAGFSLRDNDEKPRTLKGAATFQSEGGIRKLNGMPRLDPMEGRMSARDHAPASTPDPELQTYSFPHALIQETLYRSIPQRVRKANHRKIGIAMEALLSRRLDEYAPDLANHFHAAGMRAKTLEYSIRAGERLYRSMAFPEACNYYQRAYEMLRRSRDDRRYAVGTALVQSLIKTGRAKDGLPIVDYVCRIAKRMNQENQYLRTYILKCDLLQKINDYSYLSQLLRLWRRKLVDEHFNREASYLIGLAHYRQGHFQKAEAFLNRVVIPSASAISSDVLISAYVFLAALEKEKGQYEIAQNYLREGMKISQKANNTYQELRLNITLADVLMDSKKLMEATDIFLAILRRVECIGDFYLLASIYYNLGKIKSELGHYDLSTRYLSESMTLFNKLGVSGGYALAIMQVGINMFLQNRFEEAYSRYLEAATLFRKSEDMQACCHAYYNLAEACLYLDKVEEGLDWHNKGIRSFKPEDNPQLHKMFVELEKELKKKRQPRA